MPPLANSDASITNLCALLTSCGDKDTILGALEDPIADHAYSVSVQDAVQSISDNITLSELLKMSSQIRLSRKQSYAIALAIASSHLQFLSTAWNMDGWTSRDVCFPIVGQIPQLHQPYVSAKFEDPGSPSHRTPTAAASNRTFAALGIMLLELCGRRSIEESEWWSKLGFNESQKSQSLFRLIVAAKWSEEIELDEGDKIASVIKWCLHESPKILEGETWRRDLAERVVLPIQSCCQYLSGAA